MCRRSIATSRLREASNLATAQDVVVDVEDVVGIVVRPRSLQDAELRVEHLRQADVADQLVDRGQAAVGYRASPLGQLVGRLRPTELRLTPGEKGNRKRMAQVATVYSIAPFPRGPGDVLHSLRDKDDISTKGPRPADKRVWASVEKSPRAVICEAFDEALRRDPDKRRRWVVLVDGEPKQLRAVRTEARRAGVNVTILADIVHVLEYIWNAARALFGESNTKAEQWVEDRLLALLTGRSGGEVAKTTRWWEDFDAYWAFHLERERERNHASNYEDGAVPDPLPPPKSRLKRVK